MRAQPAAVACVAAMGGGKRTLSRLGVFDYAALVQAFREANIKESFVPKIYR